MTATITRYTMTVPTYKNYERKIIVKTTRTFKTEEEAMQAMSEYAKDNDQLVREADPMMWQIKKTVRKVEVDD